MDDDDKLLYGENEETEDSSRPVPDEETTQNNDDNNVETNPAEAEEAENEAENAEANDENEEVEDEEDEDSDEDNVQVIINQDKIEEAKTKIGIKPSARQLPSEKKGRFNVEDFDKVGTIDGTPAHEVDLDTIEDKPWKKPGADITDYFNYGFTEETWASYCARQKRYRLNESGAGLPNNAGGPNFSSSDSRYANKSHHNGGAIPTLGQGIKRHGGPGPSKDHHSSSQSGSSSGIAVLTADKREYSKKIFENMDFSVPPPGMNVPPPNLPNFSNPPPGTEDFDGAAAADYDYYGGGYEPTQESQWVAPPSAYGGANPNSDAPPGDAGYDGKRDPWERNGRRTSRDSPGRDRKRRRSRSRSRERRDYRDYRDRRDRDRSDRDRDRERESSSRRSERDKRRRSRSRSPRDSRSPSSSSRHKKSKREKRDKDDRAEIKKEIKDEPEDYVE